jgi:hypothetical protein
MDEITSEIGTLVQKANEQLERDDEGLRRSEQADASLTEG